MGTIKNICMKCGTVYILKQLRSVRERFNTVFAPSGRNGPIQDSRSTSIHLLDPYQADLIAPSQKYTDRISMEIIYWKLYKSVYWNALSLGIGNTRCKVLL